MNYPLTVNKKDGVTLTPHNSYYSDEYASKMCDLYLTAKVYRNEHGKMQRYYRLNAKHDHTIEQALAYNIKCPKCGAMMKQVGRQNSYTELGLYTCPKCERK